MNATKQGEHTPGPWTVRFSPTRQQFIVEGPNGWEVGGWNEANARLIASAPEMLSVLRLLLSAELEDGQGNSYDDVIRDAIAKAEGR